MERFFNVLPKETGYLTGASMEKLDNWLKKILDQPKVDRYGKNVVVKATVL